MKQKGQVIDLAEYRRQKQTKRLPRKIAAFAGDVKDFRIYLRWMRLTALMGGE